MSPHPPRVGLLTSVGATIDAFFPRIVHRWRELGVETFAAASSPTVGVPVPYTAIPSLSRSPRPRNVRAGGELRRWVAANGITHVVTNTATASAVVRLARLGVPVVYFCHGLHWPDRRSLSHAHWRALERGLLLATSGVITINRDDHGWFSARVSPDRILRLRYGVGLDPADYPRTPMPPSTTLRLCWIGELSRRKSPLDVVLLAQQLRAQGVRATVDVLGDGPLHEDLERAVREHGLQGFVGLRGRGDAAAALRDSHALLHTAHWEGLPRVTLEAAAVGRPVYAYDAKGVRDAPTVRTVSDRDPVALARLIAADWGSGPGITAGRVPTVDALDSDRAAEQIVSFLRTIHG